MSGVCHIVGAGLAGLSTAVRLASAGCAVALYEGAGQAGGRCRSYYDSKLGRTIDNGNHLIVSGNRSALSYLEEIGARDQMSGGLEACFPFVDLASGERWAVRPNSGPVPWWVLARDRRIPGTGLWDYLRAAPLALSAARHSVADRVPGSGLMAERFWDPLTIAVMNAPAESSSARLLWSVLRETFARGGAWCIPLFAEKGLGAAFVDPALDHIRAAGGAIVLNKRLTGLTFLDGKVTALCFRDETVAVAPQDKVVLALSPAQLAAVMPGLAVPQQSGVIVNAHFVLERPVSPLPSPPFIGVLNAAVQWIFVRGDVVSITISAAGVLGHDKKIEQEMLSLLWHEVIQALNMDEATEFVSGRIVTEKRATFDQSPEAAQKRPKTMTEFRNLVLAGDVVDTGLPATVEGAIRSGEAAADAILRNWGVA